MTATRLMADLVRLGIRLEAHGDRLRYSPRSAVTPELAERLKAHKDDLLAILRDGDVAYIEVVRPDGGRSWLHPDHANEDLEEIDPPDPCSECGTLELWQTMAGDLFGRTPGRWRCMKCDPPTTSRRLAEAAERIRRSTARHKGQYQR